MYTDWQAAFDRCPAYGQGQYPYGQEYVGTLQEMDDCMRALLDLLDTESARHLGRYLKARQEHTRALCRYYFYRGTLNGTNEAMAAWQEEYG